jgi:hypothetical protein
MQAFASALRCDAWPLLFGKHYEHCELDDAAGARNVLKA